MPSNTPRGQDTRNKSNYTRRDSGGFKPGSSSSITIVIMKVLILGLPRTGTQCKHHIGATNSPLYIVS